VFHIRSSRARLQGYGKTAAARAFARDPANSHAIYVDLHNCSSFDEAAKRVADAVGYRMTYTLEEKRAKKGGFGVDDLDKPWGAKEYGYVLRLFMRACGELFVEGKLKDGRPPMLLLDHVSHPFRNSKRAVMLLDAPPPAAVAVSYFAGLFDTLIYWTLESTKTSDLAENRQCRFVFITSDTTAERDSWQSECRERECGWTQAARGCAPCFKQLLPSQHYIPPSPTSLPNRTTSPSGHATAAASPARTSFNNAAPPSCIDPPPCRVEQGVSVRVRPCRGACASVDVRACDVCSCARPRFFSPHHGSSPLLPPPARLALQSLVHATR